MLNPHEIHERLVMLGTAWSELNYAAELLEETKKTLLAQIMSESGESSMAAKEAAALASPKYDEHIRKMVSARRHANTAKVKYDSAKIWAELKRTEAATERAANRNAA